MRNLILEHIHARLRQKKNYMGIACGEPGCGKSYVVLSLAEQVDSNFNIERVAFTPEEFLKIVRDDNLKSGSAVIFEEVGVGIPAREWFSISNKMVNYVFQTFRYRQLVCFFNTPSMTYIDCNTRVLFNGYIQPINIDFRREVCTVKYMEMEHNPRDERRRIYYHYIKNSDTPVKRIEITKPTEDIITPYEDKKRKFAHNLAVGALKELKELRDRVDVSIRVPNIECSMCGHRWHRRGKLEMAKCPNCGYNFRANK